MSQTADPAQLVQQALARFDQIAASDDPPSQVLQQLLVALTQTTAAIGGLIWMPAGQGPQQAYRVVTRQGHGAALAVGPDGAPPEGTAAILAQAAEQRKPIVVSPDSPEFSATELKDTAQFFVPIDAMGRVFGVVQVIAPPHLDPKTYRQYAAFIQQGTRAAGMYMARRQTQVISEDAASHAAVLQITHKLLLCDTPANLLHEAAGLATTLLEAQRVSVVGYWRKKGDVAFSNTIDVNRKAVLVRAVEMLADIARQRQSPMSFIKGRKLEEEDAAVEPPLEQLYGLGAAQAVCITPLRGGAKGDKIIGVMVAEYGDPAIASRKAVTQQELCRQAGPILDHAVAAFQRPLRRTSNALRAVRNARAVGKVRTLVTLALIAGAVYGLFFMPVDIVVRGDARLEPAVLAQITSAVDGRITAVLVETGRQVQAGQVLVEIDDQDLRLALGETGKSIEEQETAYAAAQELSKRDPKALSQLNETRLRIDGLRIRRARLLKQIDESKVRSPIAGVVLTENPDHLMHMTVNKGAMLLRVADLGSFELVTELREEDLALVDEAIREGRNVPVDFLAHAWPQKPQAATLDNLQSLAPSSAPDEYQRQHVFKVTTPIELRDVSEQLALANPTGRAKLTTGKGSLAYRYARGLWRFVQMTLLF